MAWYLSRQGVVSGPHEEDVILEQIGKGLGRGAYIREPSAEEWQPLDTHPPFADALRRHSPTIRLSKPPSS
jgi:hypothetical protein